MERIFRIDFYPHEWLTQTNKMSPAQRGIFIQIVAMIYASHGPIENDPSWIARASNCSPRLARAIIKELEEKNSIKINDGKITQNRCELELKRKRIYLETHTNSQRNNHELNSKSLKFNGLENHVKSLSQSIPSPDPLKDRSDPKNASEEKKELPNGKGRFVSSHSIAAASEAARARGFHGGDELGLDLEGIFINWIKEPPRNWDRAFDAWFPRYLENANP